MMFDNFIKSPSKLLILTNIPHNFANLHQQATTLYSTKALSISEAEVDSNTEGHTTEVAEWVMTIEDKEADFMTMIERNVSTLTMTIPTRTRRARDNSLTTMSYSDKLTWVR